MPTSQAKPLTATTIRFMYAALITGVLLFSLVAHFVMRPAVVDGGPFSPSVVQMLLGVALALCALSFVLRRLVPRRATDESVDLYWARASAQALTTWAIAEGAGLISVFVYGQTGSPSAIGVAAIALVCYLLHNPASLEQRRA
jgi:hypothetical protein